MKKAHFIAELKKPSYMCFCGVIAALYAALTLCLAPLSFGTVQLRVSEALCVLPFLWPAAIPGLFIGCIVSNAIGMAMGLTGVWDIIFGSLATLIAALLTSKMPNKWLAPLPAVIANALIVGSMLAIMFTVPEAWPVQIPLTMASVGAEEALVTYALGVPLIMVLEKAKPTLDKMLKQ